MLGGMGEIDGFPILIVHMEEVPDGVKQSLDYLEAEAKSRGVDIGCIVSVNVAIAKNDQGLVGYIYGIMKGDRSCSAVVGDYRDVNHAKDVLTKVAKRLIDAIEPGLDLSEDQPMEDLQGKTFMRSEDGEMVEGAPVGKKLN